MTTKELIGKLRPYLDAMEQGKWVQYLNHNGDWTYAFTIEDLLWPIQARCELRIVPAEKPKLKKRVPLDPEDVHPGDVYRYMAWHPSCWELITCVDLEGFKTEGNVRRSWGPLCSDGGCQISHDNGVTWQPCWKEVEE